MSARTRFAAIRFAAAALCAASLVHRWLWGLSSQTVAGQNFLAYLTIESNIAFTAVAAVGGVVALRRGADPGWLTDIRTVVLSWTITAGLVFALLMWQASLRGIPMTVPWSDVVLHFVLPAAAIAAWVLAPGRGRAHWRLIAWVVAFPVVWGLVTIWRGAQIGWYPYYFLDPRQVSGAAEFAITSAIALAVFAGVASGLIGLSRWRSTLPDDPDAAEPGPLVPNGGEPARDDPDAEESGAAMLPDAREVANV
ncbi:Pr6Pr family membrane protein [Microbacterium halophytorum]|uniref:Pr6Pr family membrane protein n=1 Tax=Microbacterium halophytorum TaxID=2067568 RepID=UPI000CFBEE8C|nr:Pr6Pr family membrane protein [Microbacterium halophytorum]